MLYLTLVFVQRFCFKGQLAGNPWAQVTRSMREARLIGPNTIELATNDGRTPILPTVLPTTFAEHRAEFFIAENNDNDDGDATDEDTKPSKVWKSDR